MNKLSSFEAPKRKQILCTSKQKSCLLLLLLAYYYNKILIVSKYSEEIMTDLLTFLTRLCSKISFFMVYMLWLTVFILKWKVT